MTGVPRRPSLCKQACGTEVMVAVMSHEEHFPNLMYFGQKINILVKVHSLCTKVFCLFGAFKNSHSFGDVTITSEGLQILISTQHSWPLSREGSLTMID